MIRAWRLRAGSVVWTLASAACLLAATAAAQGAGMTDNIGNHVGEMLAIVGTGLTCFGIAQHQAERARAEARIEREKDIRAAIHLHDADDASHGPASTKVHTPIERSISSIEIRVHDIEGVLKRLGEGVEKLLAGQGEQEAQLLVLLAEHHGMQENGQCMARDLAQIRRRRAGDPENFDPIPLRGVR